MGHHAASLSRLPSGPGREEAPEEKEDDDEEDSNTPGPPFDTADPAGAVHLSPAEAAAQQAGTVMAGCNRPPQGPAAGGGPGRRAGRRRQQQEAAPLQGPTPLLLLLPLRSPLGPAAPPR